MKENIYNRIICFFIIFLFCHGCSDNSIGFHESKIEETSKKIVTTGGFDAGQEYLSGSAQVEYKSDKGSFDMTSKVEDYHYEDKTQFDDGMEIYVETQGQTELQRKVVAPSTQLIDLRKDYRQGALNVNRSAREQAEGLFQKGRLEYQRGNDQKAIDYFQRGIGVVADSADSELALSPLSRELYFHALVLNETIGMDRLKRGYMSVETAEYFQKTVEMILRLDEDLQLKNEIDSLLPSAKKLSGFLANCYYNLGMIYNSLGYSHLRNEYGAKLRSLGRNDWADEVMSGR